LWLNDTLITFYTAKVKCCIRFSSETLVGWLALYKRLLTYLYF